MSNEAVNRASDLLKIGIKEHNGQRLIDLNVAADEFEEKFGLYSGEHSQWIHYIRDFVAGWIDASNHEWLYYVPISKDDWPNIAKQIIESLEQNQEFVPISLNGKEIIQF